MKGFESVKVVYGDKEKSIPASSILEVLAQVEEHITYGMLYKLTSIETLPYSKVTLAYCVLLNGAGFDFNAREVSASIVDGTNANNAALAIMNIFAQLSSPTEKTTKKSKARKSTKKS